MLEREQRKETEQQSQGEIEIEREGVERGNETGKEEETQRAQATAPDRKFACKPVQRNPLTRLHPAAAAAPKVSSTA